MTPIMESPRVAQPTAPNKKALAAMPLFSRSARLSAETVWPLETRSVTLEKITIL